MKRRNTTSKQVVLDILSSSDVALSQDAIEHAVKGAMDRVTVYRVLNSFCEDGYVHKIMADDGKHYFAVCLNCQEKTHRHNHFHFRCVRCQQVECLREEVNVKIPKGYKLENVHCLLTGYCKKCS